MMAFSEVDRSSMDRALELAASAKGRTFPNPAVGAVVVSGGRIVGQGATHPVGGPHAERIALAAAGRAACRGATLYVTLEPCAHHGRTPPCADAVLEAAIARVVVATTDPNPLVAGCGLRKLRRAGVRVDTGLRRSQAVELNEDFFFAVTHGRAWITLKLAMTLDGRIADCGGRSRWITGPAARRLGHELRRQHAAVAVGRGTFDIDSPRLTVRHRRGFRPARIMVTSRANAASLRRFALAAPRHRSIVVVPGRGRRSAEVEPGRHLEIWRTGTRGRLDGLVTFAEMAWEQGLTSVLIEGGRDLASSFLDAGLVNRVWLFYGSTILGGGREGLRLHPPRRLDEALSLASVRHVALGRDWAVTGLLGGRRTPRSPADRLDIGRGRTP